MEFWGYADEARKGWQHPLEKSRVEVERRDPLAAQLEHFCRVIRGEERPAIDARDGSRSLAAALSVRRSALAGRPVFPARLLAESE
jgi:predicted dehydrogenase